MRGNAFTEPRPGTRVDLMGGQRARCRDRPFLQSER